jgi:hypothetical protein
MSEENQTVDNKSRTQEDDVQKSSNTAIKESIESIENNSDELFDNSTKKNNKKIKCIRCDSYILQPNSCTFMKTETAFEGNS